MCLSDTFLANLKAALTYYLLINSCHGIAIAYSLQDNFKEALNWEKRNYTILSKLVGEKDFRTNEANIWLKQFTRKAVQVTSWWEMPTTHTHIYIVL